MGTKQLGMGRVNCTSEFLTYETYLWNMTDVEVPFSIRICFNDLLGVCLAKTDLRFLDFGIMSVNFL